MRERPFGVTILAILAAIAASWPPFMRSSSWESSHSSLDLLVIKSIISASGML